MRCLKSRLDPSRFFEPSLDLSRPAKNLSRHNTSGQQEKQSQPIESQINGKICLKSASLDECIRIGVFGWLCVVWFEGSSSL